MLDIETDGRRADDCRNRAARADIRHAGHQTAEPERPRGCESKARRNARSQPVVPALAAVWGVLPFVMALLHIPVRVRPTSLWLPKTPSDLKMQRFRSFVRSWWY